MLNHVIPSGVLERFVWVAPAHHKRAMTLSHGVADERVLWLQVQDVELVDARRHCSRNAPILGEPMGKELHLRVDVCVPSLAYWRAYLYQFYFIGSIF